MKILKYPYVDRSNLLQARSDLPWPEYARPRSYWSAPFIIDEEVSRDFKARYDETEKPQKDLLKDQIEQELFDLASTKRRFWTAEYRFLEKILPLSLLTFYAPSFLYLSRNMPPRQVTQRRQVVRKYIENQNIGSGRTVSKLSSYFTRSSVLFFPADRLIRLTDRFCVLARRSADQSVRMTRYRIMLKLHLLQVMTDQELCEYFREHHSYERELELLSLLSSRYKIETTEVLRMTFGKFDQLVGLPKYPDKEKTSSGRRKTRPLA